MMWLRRAIIKFKKQLIAFAHLQLFITLISLPILVAWGMPISLLTFAGNFLFSPLLTAFLFLSSLVFFFEVVHLPNSLIIRCLEQITHVWLWLMRSADNRMLLPLAMPSISVLILIFIMTLIILHCKKNNTPTKGIVAYAILMGLSCAYLALPARSTHERATISCNKKDVHIFHHQNQLILIDPGAIGMRLSAASWCEYTLMPFLAKQWATNRIDHCIILQPNRIIFEALASLQEKMIIKNIYIPYWQGDMPRFWLKSFMQLKKSCQTHGCTLIRLGKKPLLVLDTISIEPLDQTIIAHEFSYPAFQVSATLKSEKITLTPHKFKSGTQKMPFAGNL